MPVAPSLHDGLPIAYESHGSGKTALVLGRALHLPLVSITPDDPPGDIPSMRRHGIEVVSMSEVGHFPVLEDPDRFHALLRGVADRIVTGSALSRLGDLTPGA